MKGYIWILWDAVAVILVFFCIRKGVRDGFARTVISFTCYVLAGIVAQRYSPVLAESIYYNSIEGPLRRTVLERLEEALHQGLTGPGLAQALPGWMKAAVAAFADPAVVGSLDPSAGVERITDIIMSRILYEAVTGLLRGVIFLVAFTVLAWLIRRFARLFSGMYHIPVIGTINCILGGFLGVLQGALLLAVAGVAVQLVIALLGGTSWMNPEVIDATYIFRVFYGHVLPPIG